MNEYIICIYGKWEMENEKSVLGKYFWMVINFINLSFGKYRNIKKKFNKTILRIILVSYGC